MKFAKRSLCLKLLCLCALLAFAGQVQALTITITPTSGILDTSRWEGNETSDAAIQAEIDPIIDPATLLYKDNVGGAEEGPLAGSYNTTFSNDIYDPMDANIVYTGGAIVQPPAYLLVKDGNAEPAWYLFDLTALGWNGMDTLEVRNFWPETGAISHVSLYGTQVPEHAAMFFLAASLLGLAGVGRKKFKK